MSDWDVHLISAGSLPMEGALLGPAGTFEDTEICSNVILLRRDGRTIVIDTAAGHLDDEWEGATSDLEEALAAHGCALADIDVVILTHLDFDHCGGAADIPAERVVVSESSAAWARTWEAGTGGVADVFARIGDRLETAADGAEVAPGIRMVDAPGHRRGHTCIEIGNGARRRVFLADVIHHPSHVEHPEWDREFDSDPALGLETRTAWLRELAGTGVPCAASHIEGWGTIEAAGDGYRWQPAR
jgi:glyoxylase-like metal-dependent hydrolase (beta-lactamase superfamily II)